MLSEFECAVLVEEFWASRNVWADALNAERRAIWEKKWAGIREGDLPAEHARRIEQPGSQVVPIRPEGEAVAAGGASGHRVYWQPESLRIPMS